MKTLKDRKETSVSNSIARMEDPLLITLVIHNIFYWLSGHIKVTDAIHKITTEISSYSICRDINVDTGIIGHHEFDVDGMGKFIVDVIDSVEDYVELMKSIFDFPTVSWEREFG